MTRNYIVNDNYLRDLGQQGQVEKEEERKRKRERERERDRYRERERGRGREIEREREREKDWSQESGVSSQQSGEAPGRLRQAWKQFLLLFTVFGESECNFCCYLQCLVSLSAIFAAIY